MSESKSTTINFSEEVYRRLEAASALTGLPIDSIVVAACLEWLDRHGSERLRRPLAEMRDPSRSGIASWPFAPKAAREAERFDLLSESARRTLQMAHQNAAERAAGYIGTEHLLEGLLRVPEGNAAKVLSALSVGIEDLRRRLSEVVQPEQASEPGRPQQPTKDVRRVIEIAFEEAKKLKSRYVGTEHLLLGILVEGEGVAAHALRDSGVTEATVYDELERLVEEGS
jgi:Clp amino terminal domain, pathogenicity island component